MAMRWEDERYVRLYTRDTVTWKLLCWQGKALLPLLTRKMDRAGLAEIGTNPEEGVAALTDMPFEVVAPGLADLIKKGVFVINGETLLMPKFLEAQEASMSPNARKSESRLRQRDNVRAGIDPSQRGTVIYFLQSEHGGSIKIGRADDLAKRVVGLQTSRPDKLIVLAALAGTVQQERTLHQRFAAAREKGEWFSPVPELLDLIRHVSSRAEWPSADRTGQDTSQQPVTSHETRPVTPSRAVPCLAVPCLPSRAVEEEAPSSSPKETRAPSNLPLAVERPTKPPEAWTGDDFWQWAQWQRQENGFLVEKRLHLSKLGTWWSAALMTPGVTVDGLKQGFGRFGTNPHWEKSNPPYPFAAFMADWRNYTRPKGEALASTS